MRPRHVVLPFAAAALAAGCGRSSPIAGDPPTMQKAVAADTSNEPKFVLSPTARIAPLRMQTLLYERPDRSTKSVGYLRLGVKLLRSEAPLPGTGCTADWYAVQGGGFACAGTDPSDAKARQFGVDEATLALDHPLLRALGRPPDLSKPMPYPYGFLRANTALYLQLPSKKEQMKYEFGVREHRKNYEKYRRTWNEVDHGGANLVPLDARGIAQTPPEAKYPPPPAPDTPEVDLFGGPLPEAQGDGAPWWLERSPRTTKKERYDRLIKNVSPFYAPAYAVFAGRVYRHTGLTIVGNFMSDERGDSRRYAVTIDGRLVPTDKMKPHYASAFHGVVVDGERVRMPFAFVKDPDAHTFEESTSSALWRKTGDLPHRSILLLSGREKAYQTHKYLETTDGRWVRKDEVAYVDRPKEYPKSFDFTATRWIDVSIWNQTLVAYEGDKPVYATLVSTGIDGMGDWKTTKSTIRGEFRIDTKHVTATMDADDPESRFELRDVPWVQYFEKGYAIHATYWHDDFGKPRSHGCVNLTAIDARFLFYWTQPALPEGWHGVTAGGKMGEGTWIKVRG